jgi:NAD(P)-dependent dehydrogenase (short-subunit alcohol dehydrogenase family)
MINPMDLYGKQILVAGGTSEIGKSIVKQLLALGAKVIVVDVSEEGLSDVKKSSQNDSLHVHTYNIYKNAEIEKHTKDIVTKFGLFNGFVYCGGIGGVRPLSFTKYEFIHEMMNANLYSFIEMTRCITKKNSFSKEGSIVAISSVSSLKGLKSKTAYCASKAALDSTVRSLAAELSDKKIRVNSILKGWVTSDMNLDFIKSNMDLSQNSDFQKQLLGAIDPIEIANTVAFLLSDATISITGTSMIVDGGYSI